MRRAVAAGGIVTVGLGLIAGACVPSEIYCAGVGYYALAIEITDSGGQPLALGSTVTLYDGEYVEVDSSAFDWKAIYAADERGGRTYDVKVSRPWYQDTWFRGVRTKGGGCVHAGDDVTTHLSARLTLLPNAPAVRTLYLLPPRTLLDRSPYRSEVVPEALLDADPSQSRSIIWRITGDTGSVAFDAVSGKTAYRCRPVSGYVTVTGISAADTTVRRTMQISVQGHPATAGDAPC